jgi:hypothetical protein
MAWLRGRSEFLMFGGTVTKLATLRLKSAAADVTPNATAFSMFGSQNSGSPNFVYSTQQITGINQTITLSLSISSPPNFSVLCYKVDSASPSYSASTSPATYGFTDFFSTTNVSISNGQYLSLCGRQVSGFFYEDYGTISINNVSDGNASVQSNINWDNYSSP